MTLNDTLKALQQNFKLEPHLVVLAKETILNSQISNLTLLVTLISKSKKFDFLSKLNDAIEVYNRTDTKTNTDIEDYCLKIVKKCRNLSYVAYENKPKGYDFNHFIENAKYDCFMIDKKPAFNEKEIKLLNSVGGCKRWLRDYDENKFYENLVSAVYGLRKENTLAIEKKEFVQIENGINKRK